MLDLFNQFLFLGLGILNPKFLPTFQMEFFVRIVNSWRSLSINFCLKEFQLRCDRVPESTFYNQMVVATFLCQASFFYGNLLGNDKMFFLFLFYTLKTFLLTQAYPSYFFRDKIFYSYVFNRSPVRQLFLDVFEFFSSILCWQNRNNLMLKVTREEAK